MSARIIRSFFYSAGFLLLFAAAAKFVSSAGHSPILQVADPILGLSYLQLFLIAGGVESGIALTCFIAKSNELKAGVVAWLATGFAIYRIGTQWAGFRKPCPCLGTLTQALHIPVQTADLAMKIILAYLLIGSYASLFWLWRQSKKRNEEVRMKNEEVTPETGVGS